MLQVRNTSASCMGSNGVDVGQDNVMLGSLMCFLYSNYRKTYMLFAGWELHIVKNWELGPRS